MKYLLFSVFLISAQVHGLNAQMFGEQKQIDALDLSINAKHDEKRSCLKLELEVKSSHAFYQGEDGEVSGEEIHVRKHFSGVSLVKYIGKVENAYILMQEGAEVYVESTTEKDELYKSTLCVHESDLENSYILLVYVLEQTCAELIYLPVKEIELKYLHKP